MKPSRELCLALSASLIFSSCGGYSSQQAGPALAGKTISNEELQNAQLQIAEEDKEGKTKGVDLLNSEIQALMDKGDLSIRTLSGAAATVAQFQQGPANHLLLMRNAQNPNRYEVLSPTSSAPSAKGALNVGYKLHRLEGQMNQFQGSQLQETPAASDNLSLETSLLGAVSNKSRVDAFLANVDRIGGESQQTTNMSPALGLTYPGQSLTTVQIFRAAVIFSVVSMLTLLVGMRTIGTITAIIAIIGWLVYYYRARRGIP